MLFSYLAVISVKLPAHNLTPGVNELMTGMTTSHRCCEISLAAVSGTHRFLLAVLVYGCLHGLMPPYLSDYIQRIADSNHRRLRSLSSSQRVIRRTRLSTVLTVRFWCRMTSSQPQCSLSVRIASKLTFFPLSFPPNCFLFRFLVLYTVYSGLAVLDLGQSK